MTDNTVKQRGLEYAKYLSGLSSKERARMNESARKQGEEQHKTFQEEFQAGQCWICGDALTAFDPTKPCPH